MNIVGSRTLPLSTAIGGGGLEYRPTDFRSEDQRLGERHIHGSDLSIAHTIIVIIISAIIFVTVIALYDLIKAFLNCYYLKRELNSEELQYSAQEQLRSQEHARNALLSSVAFTVLSLIVAIVIIPVLVSRLQAEKD